MSNSYNTSTLLADPSSVVAGRKIEYQTPQRIANANNYSFAVGACHNVISQSYSDITFIQDSGSFTEMCEWRIPLVSLQHSTLEIVVNYKIHGTASPLASNIRFTLDVDGGTANVTINLPNSSNGIANDDLTITMPSPSTSQVYYATLTCEVQADSASSSEVEIKSIMCRWKPLNSPLSTGSLYQYDSDSVFYGKGTARTGHNQALTSRFAHQVIDNIELTRQRLKSYLAWSPVYNSSSSIFTNPADGAAPEVFLSVGHIDSLISQVLISGGWDNVTTRKLELHFRYIRSTVAKSFDFFGNSIDLATGTGGTTTWDTYTLELDYSALSTMGDTNLSYYTAMLDNTNNNFNTLAGLANLPSARYPTPSSDTWGFIIGLTIMGV
jgi:hypothetical protein